jgi:hypothetical protein
MVCRVVVTPSAPSPVAVMASSHRLLHLDHGIATLLRCLGCELQHQQHGTQHQQHGTQHQQHGISAAVTVQDRRLHAV